MKVAPASKLPPISNINKGTDRRMGTVFALAVMEYAVGVSKFGKNHMTL